MADNAIGILIQSQNQALADLQATRQGLLDIQAALEPLSAVAARDSEALQRVSGAGASLVGGAPAVGAALDNERQALESTSAGAQDLAAGLRGLSAAAPALRVSGLEDIEAAGRATSASLNQMATAVLAAGGAAQTASPALGAAGQAAVALGADSSEATGSVRELGQGLQTVAQQAPALRIDGLDQIALQGAQAGVSLEDLSAAGEQVAQGAGHIAAGLAEASAGLDQMVAAAVAVTNGVGAARAGMSEAAQATLDLAGASDASASAMGAEAEAAAEASRGVSTKAVIERAAASASRQNAEAQRELATGSREGAVGLLALREGLSEIAPEAAGAAGQMERMVLLLGRLPVGAAIFTGIGLAAAGAVGGILAAGEGLAHDVQGLENLNRATGASIENLQVLREVMKNEGIGFESILTPLTNLNREIAQGNPLLKELGVTARDPVEALLQLSRAVAGTTDEQSKAEIMGRLLGGRNRELLSVISDLATKFPEARQELAAFGALMGGEAIAKADAMREATNKLDTEWAGAMKNMQEALAPVATKIVNTTALLLLMKEAELAAGAAADKRKSASAPDNRGTSSGRAEADFLGLSNFAAAAAKPAPEEDPAALKDRLAAADALKDAEERAAAVAKRHADAVLLVQDAIAGASRANAEWLVGLGEQADRTKRADALLQEAANSVGGISDRLRALGLTHLDHLIGPEVPEEIKAVSKAQDDLQAKLLETSKLTGVSPAVLESMAGIQNQSGATAKELEKTTGAVERFRASVEETSQLTGIAPDVVAGLQRARDELEQTIQAYQKLGQLPPTNLVREQRRDEHQLDFEKKMEEIADPGHIQDVKESWIAAMADITSGATVMDSALHATFSAMEEGFSRVFVGLTHQGQTFASAIETIFHGMVDAILAEIARLIAAQIFKTFLKIIGFAIAGPAGAAVGTAVGGAAGGSISDSPGVAGDLAVSPIEAGGQDLVEAAAQIAPAAAPASASRTAPASPTLAAIEQVQPERTTIGARDEVRQTTSMVAAALASIQIPALRISSASLPTPSLVPVDRPRSSGLANAQPVRSSNAITPEARLFSERREERSKPGRIEHHFHFEVHALDAQSFVDYVNSPMGQGRLAELATASAARY